MDKQNLIDNMLVEVFKRFYENVLQDQHLAVFFSSEEQISELITKQYEAFRGTLFQSSEKTRAQYEKLGEMHYRLGVSLFDLIQGIEYIKADIYNSLHKTDLLQEYYGQFQAIFIDIKDCISKAYFFHEAETIKKHHHSELDHTLFYRLHTKWIIDLFDEITKLADDPEHLFRLNKLLQDKNSLFHAWLDNPHAKIIIRNPENLQEAKILHDQLAINAISMVYHLQQHHYYESYSLLKTISNDSVKLMHLLNKSILSQFSKQEEALFHYIKTESSDTNSFLAIIDILKLKLINKYRGMEAGDTVVSEIEKAIKSFLVGFDENIIFTRTSAGEFLIFFPDSVELEPDEITSLLSNMHAFLSNLKIALKEDHIIVNVAIGALSLSHISSFGYLDKMLRYALKRAKDESSRIVFLTTGEEQQALDIIKKSERDVNFVQEALSTDNIDIFFQPIFDLATNEVYDVEALARIRHGDDYITAGSFINLIHEMDVVVNLDIGVLKTLEKYIPRIVTVTNNLFINVSPSSLRNKKYVTALSSSLYEFRRFGINPVFELTEQSLLENIELISQLHRELDIRFAVDDFGSGYSSLSTVAELVEKGMIDYIKVDGSLVKNILDSDKTLHILDSVAYMSQKLDMKNIAEYIETEAVLEKVRELGIEYGQGFYFSEPMHIQDLIKHFGRQNFDPKMLETIKHKIKESQSSIKADFNHSMKPMMDLGYSEKIIFHLDEVFQAFYDRLLSDTHFQAFFEGQEQIRVLIQQQKKNFEDSLFEDFDALKIRYSKLGEMHHALMIPYVDYMKGMDILEEELWNRISLESESKLLINTLFRFFKLIRSFTAKGYLIRMIQEDKHDIDNFMDTLNQIHYMDNDIIKNRITWLKQIISAIEKEDFELVPKLNYIDNGLSEWIDDYTKINNTDLHYIEDLNKRIHIDAANLFYFLKQKDFLEILPLYTSLMSIYKLSLILSNTLTLNLTSNVIEHLKKDPLTGLYGKGAFKEVLENELRIVRAINNYFSIIIIDLDYFKNINDSYGHPIGDKVLQHTGEILRDHIRSSDYGFRIGGEELALILRGANLQQAKHIAEKIRVEIQNSAIDVDGKSHLSYTASFGVTCVDKEKALEMTSDKIYKEADDKLYESKHGGRNRISY